MVRQLSSLRTQAVMNNLKFISLDYLTVKKSGIIDRRKHLCDWYRSSGVTRVLSQGGKLGWRGPTSQHSEKKLRNDSCELDVVDIYTSWKKRKHNNRLKTKTILNIKMSPEGGSVFRFSLPGGRLAPRQLRHCLEGNAIQICYRVQYTQE